MIQLEHVSKKIGEKWILKDISLEMKQGNIYAIEGGKGTGKTTLIRVAAGLMHQTEGTVYVNGIVVENFLNYPAAVGALVDYPAFIGGYTGLENLMVLSSVRKRAAENEIRLSMESVGLDTDDLREYKKYTSVMKQKLGIAYAIMEKPDILFLDEPTRGLNKKDKERIRQIMIREKQRGALILICSSDTDFLKSISDEMYSIKNGVLIGSEKLERDKFISINFIPDHIYG